MLNLEDARRDTMELLGLSDEGGVDYITEELLAECAGAKSVVKLRSSGDDAQIEGGGGRSLVGFTDRGHSLVFARPEVHYKRGPAGSPNRECGNEVWTWHQDPGDTFTPLGRSCSSGREVYELHCPTCV